MSDPRSNAASLIARRNGKPHPERDDSDGTRYSDKQIVFGHQFTLGSSGDVYPPGRYVIETAEDSYAGSGHTAHVRKSTLLIVPTSSGTKAVPTNVGDLEAALKKDAERNQVDTGGENRGTSDAEDPLTEAAQSQLERYGIERVPSEVFVWGGYRYTSPSDAIAAAKRNEKL